MPRRPTAGDAAELTRGLFDAWSDLDLSLSALAPDAVWEAESLGTTFEGAPAIRGFLEDWRGAYADHEAEPQEIAELGNGVVFVVLRLSGRPRGGAGSALERRRPLVLVWEDGRIVKVTAPSSSIEQARAAAAQAAESRR